MTCVYRAVIGIAAVALIAGCAGIAQPASPTNHGAYVPTGQDSYDEVVLQKNWSGIGWTSSEGMQRYWRDRRAAAAEFASLFTDFASAIPDLTPAETQWVGAEKQALDLNQMSAARKDKFLNSRERRIWELHWKIKMIRRIIGTIQNSQEMALVRQENFQWVELIYEFSQEDETRENLEMLLALGAIRKSDFPKRLGVNWLSGPEEGRAQMHWDWWSRAIWQGFLRNQSYDLAYK